MIKKIIIGSIFSTLLLMSGCGDNDAENAVQTQQDLDAGNYQAVILKYEGVASTSDEYMALAAAYMQKAGLGLADLMVLISKSAEDEDADAFAAFIKSTKQRTASTALADLEKSSLNYKNVVADCTTLNLSASQKDACLYRGLAQTLKAATTIGYISDNIENFGSGTGIADDKLTSTTCSIEYAFNATFNNECTLTSGPTDITFENNATYSSVAFSVNANSFEHLINQSNFTVMTNGFCTLDDFSTRVSELPTNPTGYHVCPINENTTQEELTTEKLIVDAFNDGTSALSGIATDEMQGDIDEFKCELLSGIYTSYGESGGSCSANLNQNVTTQQVINYLNSNN